MKRNAGWTIMWMFVLVLMINFISGGTVFAANKEAESVQMNSSEKININAATSKELSALPGIGKKKAEAIVSYREKEGVFKTIEEIKNIEGIGKKTFEMIKRYIVVN